jgi:hypothetical protein
MFPEGEKNKLDNFFGFCWWFFGQKKFCWCFVVAGRQGEEKKRLFRQIENTGEKKKN